MSGRISRIFLFMLMMAVVILVMPPVSARADLSGAPGASAYKEKCAGCHAADGGGDSPVGKALKVRDLRTDAVQRQTDIELTKVIAGGKGKMPAFGKKLTTPEMQSLIGFIRTLKK